MWPSPWDAERGLPQATTLWPCARFLGRLLFRLPFGIGLAGVPRISLKSYPTASAISSCVVWISDIVTAESTPHRSRANKRSFNRRDFLRKTLACRAASEEKQGESIKLRSSSSGFLRLGAVQNTAGGSTTSEQAVMLRSSPLPTATRSRLRPTDDLESASYGCADSADIPNAPPASSASHSPGKA